MSNLNSKQVTAKSNRVYTKLKFVKSEETGSVIGFVSQNPITGRICGVRANSDYPKKICVVDKLLSNSILLNVLYDCVLIPMTDRNGYVVIAAEPVQFITHVHTTYIKNCVYLVEVKFGNKTLKFDPLNGQKDSIRSISEFKKVLEKRVDVRDLAQVIKDFEKSANLIVSLMKEEQLKVCKKRICRKKV